MVKLDKYGNKMDYIIREIKEAEYPKLEDFIFEAIFIPEGVEVPPKSIISVPEIQVYIEDFGNRIDDICVVAEAKTAEATEKQAITSEKSTNHDAESAMGEGNERKNDKGENIKLVGAAWVRIMNDFGHVDDETPSLAVSLYKEHRGMGVGTSMMNELLSILKAKGYKKTSLAVQKANYALKMYKKLGYEIIDENEEEFIMLKYL